MTLPFAYAVLSDPGRTAPSQACFRKEGAAPTFVHKEGSDDYDISGLYHTTSAIAVYASRPLSPVSMQDSLSGCWPGSTGQDLGYLLRVNKERFPASTSLPPFPGLSWR